MTEFDADLGPHGRRWIYWHVLPNRRVGVEYNCTGVPAWERRTFPVLLPLSAIAIRRLLDITPETVATSEEAVWASFDRVADHWRTAGASSSRPVQRGGPDLRGTGGIRGAARGVRGAAPPARGAA